MAVSTGRAALTSSSAWTASATASGAHAGGRGSVLRAAVTDDGTEESAAAAVGADDPRPVARAAASVASSPSSAAACTTRPPPRPSRMTSSAAWPPVPASGRVLDCAGRGFRVERLAGRAAAAADGRGDGGGVLGASLRRGRRSLPSPLRDADRGRENSADRERGSRRCGELPAVASDGGVGGGGRGANDCGSDNDDGSSSGHTGGGGSAVERFASASDAGVRSGAVRGPFTTAVERVPTATSGDCTAEEGASTCLPLLSPDPDARRVDTRDGPVPPETGEAATEGTSEESCALGGDSTSGGVDVARSASTPLTLASATVGVVPALGGTSVELVDGRRRGDCDNRRAVRRDFRWALDSGALSCAPNVGGLRRAELAGASDRRASPPTDIAGAATAVLCTTAGATNPGGRTRGGRGSRSSLGRLSTPGEVGVRRGSRFGAAVGRTSAATGAAIRTGAGRSDRPRVCDHTGGTRPFAAPFPAVALSTDRLRKLASMPPPPPCRNGGGDSGGVDGAGPDKQRLARSDSEAERSSLLRRWARTGVRVGKERGRGGALNDLPRPSLPPPSLP